MSPYLYSLTSCRKLVLCLRFWDSEKVEASPHPAMVDWQNLHELRMMCHEKPQKISLSHMRLLIFNFFFNLQEEFYVFHSYS